MAIVNSPLAPSGKVGNLVFRKQDDGRTTLSLAPRFDIRKWRTDPRYKFARRSAHNFGGASSTAKDFYQHLRRFDGLLAPRTYNHILAAFVHATAEGVPMRDLPGHPAVVTEFRAATCATALTGRELGPNHPAKDRLSFVRPFGAKVVPTGKHVPMAGGVTVHGLAETARAISDDRRKRLSCRIHLLYIPFTEYVMPEGHDTYCPVNHKGEYQSQSTGWIPAEGLPESIPLKLQPKETMCADGTAYVVLCVVEWKSMHGNRLRYHRDAASVRVLGVLHPNLPDTPPVSRTHRFRGKPNRNARPRISPAMQARLAISAFDTSLSPNGGPGGKAARKSPPK